MKRMAVRLGVLLAVVGLLGACMGLETVVSKDSPVAGDKLYVEPGYKEKLSQLKLTEVAAMPYFTKPFITVAKSSSGQQIAVVFRSSDQVDQVPLPVTYADMVSRVKENQSVTNNQATSNLHLFEINHRLVWSYTNGNGTLYWELNGEALKDPFQPSA